MKHFGSLLLLLDSDWKMDPNAYFIREPVPEKLTFSLIHLPQNWLDTILERQNTLYL